ncbi:contractile injection system protein, VgrG/Pvc8 family [Pseudomonas entomophila]|uniref:contractile injection system protein, VgrG/Pvc8 family n=1 Tax=Pseudomonas entomophila TaxID=312306 RepID=UPI001F00C4E6|nr:contractile injection system protein, VgrG/Pvc8 family [Pseudomonas entomophila]MCG8295561.1 phage baseplate assembly protein V [Pseudomonas entomophila]
MFSPTRQTHFSLTIDGVEHGLRVLAFSGEEAISRPYFFNVELVGEPAGLDLDSLIDREAFLAFDAQGNGVHGRVYHVAQCGDEPRYKLALVPQLSYLRHRINQRIYQRLSAPEIVALILEEHGIVGDAYRLELRANYRARDICTQYDETDLHFVQRLCEEEGIHFHFQHSARGHVLVLGDHQSAFTRSGIPTAYRQAPDSVADEPVIKHLMERHHAACRRTEGHSDQPRLASGHVLEITGHPHNAWNAPWLLTQVIHEGRQPPLSGEHLATGNEGDFYQGYRNRFTGYAWHASYRPPLAHRKPQVPGNQTAVVVAVEDEAVRSDRRLARVKVEFPWDREERVGDTRSCWLRLVSDWHCESMPPRKGMEVRVTFLEGDPDQPLISGCVCCSCQGRGLDGIIQGQ